MAYNFIITNMKSKVKVLLIQEELKNYRDPIYSLISKQVDLTVGYTTSNEIKESSYPIISLSYKKIGSILWHKNLRHTINNYDVIVYVPHLRMIRVATLPFIPHKPKLVTWSLGIHASYNKLYDLSKAPDMKDRIFESIQDHADACIFYMPEPIEYWKKYRGIDERKYFVAHNTVAVADYDDSVDRNRDIILFVGTLYQQKGINELINCYVKAKQKVGKLPPLKIIGEGPERNLIQRMVEKYDLIDDIELIGAIYEEDELKEFFLHSIICVSPKQAGLSVLKSLGYGVPFVTRTDAITGGEKTNIKDGETGIFYNSEKDLVDILVSTVTNPERFTAMSKSSREYYLTNASPDSMAKGVIDAINYALKKNELF